MQTVINLAIVGITIISIIATFKQRDAFTADFDAKTGMRPMWMFGKRPMESIFKIFVLVLLLVSALGYYSFEKMSWVLLSALTIMPIYLLMWLLARVYVWGAAKYINARDKFRAPLDTCATLCPHCGSNGPHIIRIDDMTFDSAQQAGRFGLRFTTLRNGMKIPQLIMDGRGSLPAVCARCGQPVVTGDKPVAVVPEQHVAVIGPRHSGKSAFIYALTLYLTSSPQTGGNYRVDEGLTPGGAHCLDSCFRMAVSGIPLGSNKVLNQMPVSIDRLSHKGQALCRICFHEIDHTLESRSAAAGSEIYRVINTIYYTINAKTPISSVEHEHILASLFETIERHGLKRRDYRLHIVLTNTEGLTITDPEAWCTSHLDLANFLLSVRSSFAPESGLYITDIRNADTYHDIKILE